MITNLHATAGSEGCRHDTHWCRQRWQSRHHDNSQFSAYGPLARYEKLWVAHAPGMPGTFSPPPRLSDSAMHPDTCVTHVPWCMPGALTSGFLWSRWRGKRSWHSRRMRNAQSYVSGKRPVVYKHCSCPPIDHGGLKTRCKVVQELYSGSRIIVISKLKRDKIHENRE